MKGKLIYLIGDLLILLMPKKAKKLAKTGMTITDRNKITLIELFMRKSLLKKVEDKSDYNTLSEFHKAYWKNKGDDFFTATDFKTISNVSWWIGYIFFSLNIKSCCLSSSNILKGHFRI